MLREYHVKLRGRVSYFLICLIIAHFAYPFSELSTLSSAIYVVCYSAAIGFGAYLTSQSQTRWRITGFMTLLTMVTGAAAFGIHTYTMPITWQRMYYLSFTTLTTLGFGDITPVNAFVEPFV